MPKCCDGSGLVWFFAPNHFSDDSEYRLVNCRHGYLRLFFRIVGLVVLAFAMFCYASFIMSLKG